MDAIRIEKLTKQYRDLTAVDRLELSIRDGEMFGLLGVNGAGKTTTIKMLSCLVKPDGGDAFVYDASINKDMDKVRSYIGISPQETAVAPNLTVRENLKLMCGIYGYDRKKTEDRINELVETYRLKHILSKRAGKLSGGWQRRLSIAMALVGEPRALFLDEPTLGLDVIARSELWDSIRDLKGRKTIILTTHYMEEAEALCDRIGIMRDGQLLALGTSEELKALAGKNSFEEAFIAIVKGEAR